MAGDSSRKTIPLSKTTKFIVDNRGRTAPTADCGIPLIATNCISNERLHPSYEKLRFVSKETYTNWFRSHPMPGDIILTNKGSQNGQVCLVPDPVDFVIAQDMVALRADENTIDPLFLFAALRSAEVQREIKNLDVSGVIPHFKKTDFDKLHLPYPERHIQESIGSFYYNFCAKIELNRRTNATLEAMARALFQSWFVDFDPVRAKLDGRQPVCLDPATAALFPNSFQDSELGYIPKGWTIQPLSKLTQYFSRGIGPVYLEEGGVCVLNQKCVRDHRVDFSKSRRHDPARRSVNDRVLQPNDILVNSTGAGTLGRVAQLFDLPEPAIVDSHVTIVRAAADTDPFFLGINLTGREAEIEALGEGSTGQTELSRTRLGGLDIVTPPFKLQRTFGETVGPLLKRISANEKQSRTLATLRDTLLPKLLSGEIRVKEIA